MEVEKNNKNMYDIKPFKILNAELLDRGIVDDTFSVLSDPNSKGKRSRLRIKRHKINKDDISIANLNKWNQKYNSLFKSMADPWNTELEDLEGNLTGTSESIHKRYCERYYQIKKKTTRGCRKYKLKKTQKKTKNIPFQKEISKQGKTKSKTRKKTRKKTQKATVPRIIPYLEED